MILHTYQCDICKSQSKKIFQVTFNITSSLINNGDNKPTAGVPATASCEVCSDKCAGEALAKVFKKMKGEVIEVTEEKVLEKEVPDVQAGVESGVTRSN